MVIVGLGMTVTWLKNAEIKFAESPIRSHTFSVTKFSAHFLNVVYGVRICIYNYLVFWVHVFLISTFTILILFLHLF